MDKIWYNIYTSTAKSLGLKLSNVEMEEIFNSQFKFMKETYGEIDIYEEDLPVIYIPEFGRFYGKRVKTKNLRKSKLTKELKKLKDGNTD